jgi:hypothetical protein
MDNVAMTAADICGVQLAIVNTSAKKPILYQFAWKILKFIKNKSSFVGRIGMPYLLSIFQWSSWENFIIFLNLVFFCRIASIPTELSTTLRKVISKGLSEFLGELRCEGTPWGGISATAKNAKVAGGVESCRTRQLLLQ